MQNQRLRFGSSKTLCVQLVAVNIVVRGDRGLVLAFGLDAQHDDDVGVFERFLDFINAADRSAGRYFFQFARNPHGGAAQREAAAKFSEQVNVGAGYTRMREIAEDGDV